MMMKFKTISLLLVLILWAETTLAGKCKTSGIRQKDGYIIFDQTKLSSEGKKRLINHAISVVSAVMSTYKLVKSAANRCKAPSYFLYNGANVVDGTTNLMNLLKQEKESKQILEAFVGEGSNIEAQIDVFDKAREQQITAYRAARKRERILKTTSIVRKSAVVAAGVEVVVAATSGGAATGYLICSPNEEAAKGARDAMKKGVNNRGKIGKNIKNLYNIDKYETTDGKTVNIESEKWSPSNMGQNISGTIAIAILKARFKEKVGEISPDSRFIYYGAQEILATLMSKDMNKVSHCMKQRAGEFKAMVSALRQRLGTTPDGGNSGTDGIDVRTVSFPNRPEEFDINDFAGCMATSSSGLANDPQCRCRQNNSCYQIPSFTPPKNNQGGGTLGFPAGVASINGLARDFLNGAFSGNMSRAHLGAGRLGQGAARLDRQIKAIQKKINKDRKRRGKRPISFAARKQRIIRNIQNAVGKALDGAGIQSIGQFNRAVGDALIKDPNLIAHKTTPVVAAVKGKRIANNNNQGSFDFLGDDEDEKINADMAGMTAGEGEQDIYTARGEDIHGPRQNIFKMLTYRYMKSGYPLLLKKVEKGPSPSGKTDPF